MAAPPRTYARARIFDTLFRWMLAVEAFVEVRRQRRALLALSGRALKDIGVSRCEAEWIAAMPFVTRGGSAEPVNGRRDVRLPRPG